MSMTRGVDRSRATKPVRSWRRARTWAPPLVLALGLLGTGLVTRQLALAIRRADDERFLNDVQNRQGAITERLNNYAALMRATAGMFAARPDTTARDFSRYFLALDLANHYPGLQGLGFSRTATGRVAVLRLDAELHELYGSGVGIWPPTADDERHAIVYLQPMDPRHAGSLGYDMSTDPVRRVAMERARDGDTVAASGAVTLVQEADPRKQHGFVLYMPVYSGSPAPATVAGRRTQLLGFVYAPFRIDDLFTGIFGTDAHPQAGFELFDGPREDPGHSMYRSVAPPGNPRHTLRMSVEIAGRSWTLRYFSLPPFDESSNRMLLPFVAAGGALLSLLFAGIVAQQIRARAHGERREAALQASEARMRLITESVRDHAIITKDVQGRVTGWNPGARQIFGYTAEDILGRSAAVLFTPEDRAEGQPEHEMQIAAERGLALDERTHLRSDGRRFFASGSLAPLHDESGKLRGFVKVLRDMSAQREAAEQRELLIGELNHRVKNTLAIVQSVARQTRRGTDSLAVFEEAFLGRLHALGRTHDLLTREGWEGASLEDILQATLAPYTQGGPGGRLRISGPPVRVSPQRAVTLTMVFHELATNAVKYGALTRSEGRVEVEWTVDASSGTPVLSLAWLERGGPPVGPPDRRGFGSRLIEQALARELDGEVSLEFAPGGLECRMRFPLERCTGSEPS